MAGPVAAVFDARLQQAHSGCQRVAPGRPAAAKEDVALHYAEHPPPPSLVPYVRCAWELSGEGLGAPQLLVPDGCMELVLNLADPFEQLEEGGLSLQQPRALLVGELRRPVTTRPQGRMDLLAVRFEPGAIPVFFDVPPGELADRMPDGAAVARPQLRRALPTVLSAEPGDRLGLLWSALEASREGPLDPWTRRAVAALRRVDGCLSISELEASLGVTRRHLERRFGNAVGVSPKSYAQVLRFRRALQALEALEPDWVGVALACGYYDQSHLIRDFKRYTGMAPGAWLREDHPLSALFAGSR